jgi:hypothetical protein
MNSQEPEVPLIFHPGNEPYLGRKLLYNFDQLISLCLEQNSSIAPKTHQLELSETQRMACIVIPQAISIALSIRELIRQGYLFGAKVLIRPLVERSAILQFINICPNEIEKWNRGWQHGDAPSLAKMFEVIQERMKRPDKIKGAQITNEWNSMLHGRPELALANLITLDNEHLGFSVSKILNRPDLCDDICAEVSLWLIVVQSMMTAYFGETEDD